MARKRGICPDCGEKLKWPEWQVVCSRCRENYDTCSRCGELQRLEDMRQAYCLNCRRSYDRDRWARQRAARGV
jgi:hypothetical protein